MFFKGLGLSEKEVCPYEFNIRTFPSYSSPFGVDGKIIIPEHVKNIRFDVGLSQTAHFSQYWLDCDKDLFVICIEPSRFNLARIISGTGSWIYKLNPGLIDARCYLLPYACKNISRPEISNFYYTEVDSGCSSVHMPIEFSVKKKTTVECINLDWILRSICSTRFPVIDYIKLDCQAEDGNILMSIMKSISRVAVITFEYGREIEMYNSNLKELNYYKNQLFEKGFFEVNLESLNKFNIDTNKFITGGDPTFVNTAHLDYIRGNNLAYVQSSEVIHRKLGIPNS